MSCNPVFLIIAGTLYGRELSEALCRAGARVYASVATEYGQEAMESASGQDRHQNLTILSGVLDREGMEEVIREIKPDALINAAHPYAAEACRNSKEACATARVRYLRLLRDSQPTEDLVCFQNLEEAVRFLNTVAGNIFSACGGKEIGYLTGIADYRERVFIRALPRQGFLRECQALGIRPKNIICMQGPFSKELNIAMFRSTKANWLLTRDSGGAGGFAEKIAAAAELGVKVVLIGRPVQDEGLYYEELIKTLREDYHLGNLLKKGKGQ